MSDSEPKPTVQYIDISKGPLGESYPLPHFVMVIDNAFTPAKCAEILAIGKSTQEEWGEGLINNGRGQQVKAIDVRNCGRIIRDDPELAERLLARVRPFLKDVELVGGGASPEWPVIIGGAPITWKITRLNERLRFLKYGPGQYFEPHCDANYSTYSGTEGIPASELSKLQPEEKSLITFHLYLTDVEEGAGGATTIHSWNLKESLDIHSKQGRVMIFQQRDLLHSGQKLTSGVKYTLRSDLMYTRVVKDKK